MVSTASKKRTSGKKKPAKWEVASNASVQNLRALVEDGPRWNQDDLGESLAALENGLEKLCNVQRPKSSDDDPVLPNRCEDDFRVFGDWLRDHHAIDLEKLHLRIAHVEGDEDNVTLVAMDRITAGSHLVSVPDTAMISTKQIAQLGVSPVLRLAPELAQDPSVLLSLVLLAHALDESSPYRAYIRVLPRSFTTPFWSFKASTLMAIRPSPAFHRGVNTIRALVRRYARVYSALRQLNLPALPIEQFTFTRYMWAVSVVMTRQNEIPTSPRALALVPVWDLCNHSPGNHSTSVAITPGSNQVYVECNAMRDFEPGDAVTICYGSRPNTELLLFSGFVQPSNLFDRFSLPLLIPRSDPLSPLKLRILKKAQVAVFPSENANSQNSQMVAKVNANSDGTISPDGLAVARVIVMDKEALTDFFRSGKSLPTSPLSNLALEDSALNLIADIAKRLIDRYTENAEPCGDENRRIGSQWDAIQHLRREERLHLQRIIRVHEQ